MSRKRKWRSYVMRGPAKPSEERATVLDAPDARIGEVPMSKLTPEQIRVINRATATDPRVQVADRCFLRWAATPYDSYGAPQLSYIILVNRSGTPSHVPLDDAESKIVDTVVRAAPYWAAGFVRMWYRSEMSVTQIAEQLKVSRREYVYAERERVLFYFVGRLHEVGCSIIPRTSEPVEA